MLRTYFEISLGISAVILLIMAVIPLIKKRYSAAMCCGIWLVCAVMLIIPFKFQVTGRIQIPEPENKIIMSARSEPQEEIQTEKTSFTEQTAVEAAPAKDTWTAIDLYGLLTAVWLCGAGAFMMYHIIGYILFCRKIRPWCKPIGLTDYNAKPRLTECALLKSPMLVGFIKPRIMLPRADYSEYELRMILKHELEHYRRGDLYKKLLLIIANAVHWFNPLVYVMRSYANRDIEYSCDERVVRGMSGQEKKDYSLTILRCAAGGMQTAFSTYLNEDKKNLKQRFANILSGGKKRGIILGVIVCALSVVCAGTVRFVSDDVPQSVHHKAGDFKNAKANYLFMGFDQGECIDTIALVSLSEKGKLTVMSIPRDTSVIEKYREADDKNIQYITDAAELLLDCHIKGYLVTDMYRAQSLLQKFQKMEFEIPELYGSGTGMVYDAVKSSKTNLNADDIKDIWRTAKKGKAEFTILEGEYAVDANGEQFYNPQNYLRLDSLTESVSNAVDSDFHSYRVTRFITDGKEMIKEDNRRFGVWCNERLGMLHLCLIPALSDGTYAVIQPYSDIEYDAELGKANGKFVFKNMTKAEAGETIQKEIFDGTIIGLNTNTPTLHSDDDKYLVQLFATDRK